MILWKRNVLSRQEKNVSNKTICRVTSASRGHLNRASARLGAPEAQRYARAKINKPNCESVMKNSNKTKLISIAAWILIVFTGIQIVLFIVAHPPNDMNYTTLYLEVSEKKIWFEGLPLLQRLVVSNNHWLNFFYISSVFIMFVSGIFLLKREKIARLFALNFCGISVVLAILIAVAGMIHNSRPMLISIDARHIGDGVSDLLRVVFFVITAVQVLVYGFVFGVLKRQRAKIEFENKKIA